MTLHVHSSDPSIVSTLQQYLPREVKVLQQKEFAFRKCDTARELLSQVPPPKQGELVLVVYHGKMCSDKIRNDDIKGFQPKQGYHIDGLAEPMQRRAIISSATNARATRHAAVHECGHLLGLPHCKSPCFMSNGLIARKNTFSWCKECWKQLSS